jgi:hypothetical protein
MKVAGTRQDGCREVSNPSGVGASGDSVVAGEAAQAREASRLDADESELGILKVQEHGQWPLRRSYVLASTAAAWAPTHFCSRQEW